MNVYHLVVGQLMPEQDACTAFPRAVPVLWANHFILMADAFRHSSRTAEERESVVHDIHDLVWIVFVVM